MEQGTRLIILLYFLGIIRDWYTGARKWENWEMGILACVLLLLGQA